MKKILIIDDKQVNIELAKRQLGCISNVELYYVSTFEGACHYFSSHEFDAVFTDCMMPGESKGVSSSPEIGKDTTYGLILAIMAVNRGVPCISIVTDLSNHHSGPIPWALDQVSSQEKIIKCVRTKDWLSAYRLWFGEPEIIHKNETVINKLLIITDNWPLTVPPIANFTVSYSKKEVSSIVEKLSTKERPTHILLVGELEFDQGISGCKNEYELIESLNTGDLKIVVAGFRTKPDDEKFKNLTYLRLPFVVDQLLDVFVS